MLDRTRNGNGYAPDRIGFPDIRALAGDRIDEWEIAAILAMDSVRQSDFSPAAEAEPDGPPMTLSMFKEWVA